MRYSTRNAQEGFSIVISGAFDDSKPGTPAFFHVPWPYPHSLPENPFSGPSVSDGFGLPLYRPAYRYVPPGYR